MYLFRRTEIEIKPTNHCELWVHESLTQDLHRAIGALEHNLMGCFALRSGPLPNGGVPGKNGLMFHGTCNKRLSDEHPCGVIVYHNWVEVYNVDYIPKGYLLCGMPVGDGNGRERHRGYSPADGVDVAMADFKALGEDYSMASSQFYDELTTLHSFEHWSAAHSGVYRMAAKCAGARLHPSKPIEIPAIPGPTYVSSGSPMHLVAEEIGSDYWDALEELRLHNHYVYYRMPWEKDTSICVTATSMGGSFNGIDGGYSVSLVLESKGTRRLIAVAHGTRGYSPEVVRYCDKEHFVTYATELKEKFCPEGFEKEVSAELESALRTAQNAIYPGLP